MKRTGLHRLVLFGLIALILAGVGVAAWLVARYSENGRLFAWRWWRVLEERDTLERALRDLGPWGPAFIVLAEVLQVVFAPVPGQVVGLVAGYLYGFWWGTLYCMIGLALGSLAAVWLARRLGRPLVRRLAGEEVLARIDDYAERRGALALLLIFLLPFLPDDLCCLAAGLTKLSILEVVLLAVVGRLPGLMMSTLLGAQAHRLTWPQVAVIALLGIALAVLFARYQDRLERAMFRLVDRLLGRERQGRE